jgi:hypothetical protein
MVLLAMLVVKGWALWNFRQVILPAGIIGSIPVPGKTHRILQVLSYEVIQQRAHYRHRGHDIY